LFYLLRPIPRAATTPAGEPGFGELLVKAAKESPGFLGIETGRTSNGTLVIFAWFENKKALVNWYKSDFHERAMKSAFPKQNIERVPVPDIPDDTGSILALVTLKLSDGPPTAASPIPIQRIGIELYTPLPAA
jgi:heme-degrading monooxygenase HmoA